MFQAIKAPIASLSVAVLIVTTSASAHDGEHKAPDSTAPLQLAAGVDLSLPPVKAADPACRVTLNVIDPATGMKVHGLIRATTPEGRLIKPEGLMSRADALTSGSIGPSSYAHMNSWSILPGSATIDLPRTRVRIEFFQGLETHLSEVTVDLTGQEQYARDLTLTPVRSERSPHWHAGNTHLHLQRMTLAEAEDYACQTASADGYDIVFFSYLERARADEYYISNHFTDADLTRFTKRSGVVFGYGEEYRHNLVDHHEGYGHVMFLDLATLILPASLGQSITKTGNDDTALRPGIINAREQDATVLWCHGTRGLEDVPSWLAGLIDVQMIFDQGSLGTYEEALYRYWGLGLRAPIAAGTDWFFRDMATVYAYTEAPLSPKTWLRALREGRSYISNGPLLDLTVNGEPIGSEMGIESGELLTIEATAHSAVDFGALEIVINGQIFNAESKKDDNGFNATLVERIRIAESSWIAARVTPFNADYDRPADAEGYFNAYGKPVFAHTSPIYVHVDNAPIFQPDAARALLTDLENSRAVLMEKGDYSSRAIRENVLRVYDETAQALRARLNANPRADAAADQPRPRE